MNLQEEYLYEEFQKLQYHLEIFIDNSGMEKTDKHKNLWATILLINDYISTLLKNREDEET